MTAFGRTRTRRIVAAFVATSLVLTFATSAVVAATPSTPAIEEKKSDAAAAQDRLDELAAQLELRGEEYAAILAELEVTNEAIRAAREDSAEADRELAEAQRRLGDRAAGIYRGGGIDMLGVLLGTSSFQDFLTRLDWLRRVNRSDADLVTDVKDAREKVRLKQEALERRKEEQITLRDQASAAKRELEGAVADQSAFVDGLNAEVTQLIREEQERQERIAAERARRAAEAARRAQQAAAERAGNGGNGGNGGSPSPERESDASELGPGHPEVVAIGLEYVGVPYKWGGCSPGGFDCSGLTQYVYAKVGISLPRTSRSQYGVGAHVPSDRVDLLVAGDLVFFGYGADPGQVHHVGIYVGNGDYLHAPQSGQNVRVDSLNGRIESRGDYVGASRL
ncbi:MAG: NlpC/P60 family protein [Coriobacteriia bacterium]|nr:NlpC/P60 family protein [Coriobacteriia bacterium]